MKIQIRETDDWIEVKVDNKLVHSGHNWDWKQILSQLHLDYDHEYVEDWYKDLKDWE